MNLERPVKKGGAIIGMSNDADISKTGNYVLSTQKLSLTLLLDTHSCQKGPYEVHYTVQKNVSHYSLPSMAD